MQGIITELSPLALYVHCNCHVLNLVIVTSCSLPVVRNMAGTTTELSNLFEISPKLQRMFTNVIALEAPDQKKNKLKNLCKTRWVYRHEAYDTFFELYSMIVRTLEAITNPIILTQSMALGPGIRSHAQKQMDLFIPLPPLGLL